MNTAPVFLDRRGRQISVGSIVYSLAAPAAEPLVGVVLAIEQSWTTSGCSNLVRVRWYKDSGLPDEIVFHEPNELVVSDLK